MRLESHLLFYIFKIICSGPGCRNWCSDYGLEGSGFETRFRRNCLRPSSSSPRHKQPLCRGYRGASLMAYRPGRGIDCPPTSVVEVQTRAVLLF